MQKTKQIQFFITENSKSYIKNLLEKLNIETHSRILNRLVRLEYGIYGDYKQIKGRL